jgi:hypothetical protein
MKGITRSRLLAVGVVTVSATIGVGITFAASNSSGGPGDDVRPVQIAPTVSRPAAPTPARSADEIVPSLLARLNAGREILAAELGAAPAGTSAVERETPDAEPVPPAGRVLYVTIPETTAPGGGVRAIWLANLLGGAVSDELDRNGLGRLISIQILERRSDGTTVNTGGGISNVVPHQAFSAEPPAAMAARVRSAAREAGLTVRDVEVFRAVQNAPAAVVVAPDVRQILSRPGQIDIVESVFGDVRRLEGFYLEVQNAQGESVMKLAGANRAVVGQVWISPRYERPPTLFDGKPANGNGG